MPLTPSLTAIEDGGGGGGGGQIGVVSIYQTIVNGDFTPSTHLLPVLDVMLPTDLVVAVGTRSGGHGGWSGDSGFTELFDINNFKSLAMRAGFVADLSLGTASGYGSMVHHLAVLRGVKVQSPALFPVQDSFFYAENPLAMGNITLPSPGYVMVLRNGYGNSDDVITSVSVAGATATGGEIYYSFPLHWGLWDFGAAGTKAIVQFPEGGGGAAGDSIYGVVGLELA